MRQNFQLLVALIWARIAGSLNCHFTQYRSVWFLIEWYAMRTKNVLFEAFRPAGLHLIVVDQ